MTSPLGSHSVVPNSASSGAASAAPLLAFAKNIAFGGMAGNAISFKAKITEQSKVDSLKEKYQNFFNLVQQHLGIDGEVLRFSIEKGLIEIKHITADTIDPTKPPKEKNELFDLPLLASRLNKEAFNELNQAFQDVYREQVGEISPDGLKKNFKQQLGGTEKKPFSGYQMLKGKAVNRFLQIKTAEQLNRIINPQKTDEEIRSIQNQLDLAKKSGLVREGHEPAVLLALFEINPADLRNVFQQDEPEEKHWYSVFGVGKDSVARNRQMAFKMIDKIIAECQAFSLNQDIQQEATRFFHKNSNLTLFGQKYGIPDLQELDILFLGEKKEWKSYEEWLTHLDFYRLSEKEKLAFLGNLKRWKGEDYRENLALSDNPSEKDIYFQTQTPTDEELDGFLANIVENNEQKRVRLKETLKSSLKEGKTLKDLKFNELVERLGSKQLAKTVQDEQEKLRHQALQGFASPLGQASGSAESVASIGGPASGRSASSNSSPAASRRESLESVSRADLEEARSSSSVAPQSSTSSLSVPSRASSPAPSLGSVPPSIDELQDEYNWIEGVYKSLHQNEMLKKQNLQPLYGFDIGRDRSYLEDVFAQKRRLNPKLDEKVFLDSYSPSIGWAKKMLDKHLKDWIKGIDPTFTDDKIDILQSSPKVRPLLDALAQAYDPRLTRDGDQKLRTFATLKKASWDQDVLTKHREEINILIQKWDAFSFNDSIRQKAQPLKTSFLSRQHENIEEALQALNDRLFSRDADDDRYNRYEIETNFTGSPTFSDWAQKPENLYDTKVKEEHDGFKFKEALKKPEVKKAFLERCQDITDVRMDFATKYALLSKELYGHMDHYSAEEQARFFEEFILSSNKEFPRWLEEKEIAVAKRALEDFTKHQSEIFKQVFQDEDFKNLFIQGTKGKEFSVKQNEYFRRMQEIILRQTDALQVGAITKDQIADTLRRNISQELSDV